MKVLNGTSMSTNFVQRSIDPLKQASDYCTIRCSKHYLQISYPACVRLLRRCLGQFRPGTCH